MKLRVKVSTNQEQSTARSRMERVVIAVGACIAQAIVALYTLVAGSGWSGITYTVAVSQAGLALVVIVGLAFIIRRPWLLFLVPLLCTVLSIALGTLGEQTGETGF